MSGAIPLGFTFYYMGQPYTQVYANSNGFLSFNSASTGATGTEQRTNALSGSPASLRPVIAPIWDDLMGSTITGSTPLASYLTTGAAGSRIFTFEWRNWAPYSSSSIQATISFQVKLFEATGAIQFEYQRESGTTAFAGASIGISATGTGAGNYLSLNGSGAAPTVSSATETTNITVRPATGQIYTFSPQAGTPSAPGTMTFTSVGATTTTVNWVDNSVNETYFVVSRSTDGVSYTPVTTISSTTTAGTGTGYLYAATGLAPSTLYYWRVTAANEGNAPSSSLDGSQATLAGSLCGTYTVGPTGNYTSLTAAFADLTINSFSCPVIFELQAAYVSTVETFPLNITNMFSTSTNTLTVRPEAGATNLSITSNVAQTINMNGTAYITFDGRPGGTGTASQLTIENTSASGIAVQLTNGTQNCGLNYLQLRGQNTSTTGGVVVFGNGAAGNSNNTIANSGIFRTAGGQPANLIYSSNSTTSAFNAGNIVNACNLYDNFTAGSVNAAILLSTGNNAWTITNNHIYQTATQTYTSGNTHFGIRINTGGTNFTVTGNFIGGSAMNCGGTAWTIAGGVTNRFIGIDISSGTGTASNIHSNTIRNFNLSTTSGASANNGIWCGINITGGSANVGTVATPNFIGSSTGNQVTTLTSSTGGTTVGINSSASGTVVIAGNQIGGITANGSTASISTSITGILVSAGTNTISNNLVGSTTVLNSLVNAASTNSTAGSVTGINSSASGTNTISSNVIASLTSQYIGTGTGQVRGIVTSSGTNIITGNTISVLSAVNAQTGTTTSASVIGISQSSTSTGQVIRQNNIANIGNLGIAGNVSITGIYHSGGTAGDVSRNVVIALGAPNNTATPIINGMVIAGGSAVVSNNVVSLGTNISGGALTRSHEYNGMVKSTSSNNKFYYNSVSVSGAGVATGTANSYAFRRTSTAVDTVYNNIFSNTRSNGASTGTHYAISISAGTTFVSNNNDLFGNGTGFILGAAGATNYASLGAWQGGTSQDGLSVTVDPGFISATDLHITTGVTSSLESKGRVIPGITIDYENDTRPGPAGSVNGGGIAPDIGADEFDGIPVLLDVGASAFVLPVVSNCYTASETVRVRIRNYSSQAINFSVDPVTVSALSTGPNPMAFGNVVLNTGTLAGGATLDTVVAAGYNMSLYGTYTFKAYTTLTGDGSATNDTIVNTRNHIAPVTLPQRISFTGFTGANLGTVFTGWGEATGAVAPVAGTSGWEARTGLGGAGNVTAKVNLYNTSHRDWITAPKIVPSAGDTLSYDIALTNFDNFNTDADGMAADDRFYVMISTTCGATWSRIDSVTAATGLTNQLTRRMVSLAPYAGQQIYLGFYATDGTSDDGPDYDIHLDNIFLGRPDTVDVGITAITAPVSGTCGSTQTQVVVTVRNYGRRAVTNFPVNVNVTGSLTTTLSTVVPSVSIGQSVSVVVGTINSSAGGTYNFKAYTSAAGEQIPANDTSAVNGIILNPLPAVTTIGDATICPGSQITLTTTGTASGIINTTAQFAGALAIPDANPTGVESSINISTVGTASQVTFVRIDSLTHGWVEDLDIYLIAPDGSQIELSTDNGSSGDNYIGTVFTPSASSSITSGTAPFTGNFLPEQPFSGLTGSLNGTWKLKVVDDAALLSGTIRRWTIGYTVNNTVVTYSWTPAAGLDNASLQNPSASASGQYVVTATDARGCQNRDTVTITQYTLPVLSTAVTDVTCAATDGAVNLTVTGGTPSFSYAWSNSASTEDISNVAAGTYSVTVTDGNGCTTTTSANVGIQPGLLTISSVAVTNASCNSGSDGAVNITTSGGTIPFTFAWSNSASTEDVSGLTAGTYSVLVTDDLGCTATASANVTEPTAIALSSSVTNTSCNLGSNGAVNLTGTGGTGLYSYSWSNSASTEDISGVAAGTYSVTVTDANGCTATHSATVHEPSALTSAIVPANVTCQGLTNGSANLTASGGTPGYTYSWSNSATTEDISGLGTGTYTVTITDINSCTHTDSVAITEPTALTSSIASTNVLCFGGSTGTATVTANGGTTGYTYNWTPAGGTGATANGLPTGTYTVTVTDANGCTRSSSVTLTEPPMLTGIITSTTNISCNGAEDGAAVVSAGFGTPGYTYSWSPAGGSANTATGLDAGTYTVTVTDANGCTASASTTVTEPGALAVSLTATDEINGNDGAVNSAVSGGTVPYTYNWSNGQVTPGLSLITSGTYTVTVTDANGCTETASVTVNSQVSVPGENAADISIYPNPSSGHFTISVNGFSGGDMKIEIMDMSGKLIEARVVADAAVQFLQPVDLDGMPAGTYFVRMISEKSTSVHKIVITR